LLAISSKLHIACAIIPQMASRTEEEKRRGIRLASEDKIKFLQDLLYQRTPRAIPLITPDGREMLVCDGQFRRKLKGQIPREEVHILVAQNVEGSLVLQKRYAVHPGAIEIEKLGLNGKPKTTRIAASRPEYHMLVTALTALVQISLPRPEKPLVVQPPLL
jgi:hypothetical protein